MKTTFRQLALALGALIYTFAASSLAQNCLRTSVGLKPLTELGTETYQSYQGGLYPNGQNQRLWKHDSAGRALAQQVKPLNPSGTLDPANGKIVLLSIGMSNATQEFSAFKPLADGDPAEYPQLTIVDGAQGGQTAAIISKPSADFWTIIDQRLATAGVTRQQVQVAWVKEADASPTQSFPTHALTLQSELEAIARILKSKYPNIKLSYWSSRTYGGYATTSLNPEPYAYESAFAIKWIMEKQIGGDTSLTYSDANTKVPWLAWGPYLWANGTTPRSDGLTWECVDFQSDGTHPSSSGRTKVGNLLLNFFKSDPTATPWFLRPPTTSAEREDETSPHKFSLGQNYPNPFNPGTAISFQLSATSFVTLRVFNLLGKEVAKLVDEEKQPGTHSIFFDTRNSKFGALPSGVYVYRLTVGSMTHQKSMLLIR